MRTILILPHYRDKKPFRAKEIAECLLKNLNNNLINEVVAVTDVKDIKLHHKKLTVINIGRRQTYKALFELGHTLNPGGISIVSNADIYFKPEDIRTLQKVNYDGLVLALSRWDIMKKGKPKHHALKDSQDVWIFRDKIEIENDFELGRAGCDNVIAHELRKKYMVMNPSRTIKSYHLHLSNIRNYKKKNAYQPPYYRVPVCQFSDRKIKKVLHIGLNPKGQTELEQALRSPGKYVFFDWQKIKEKKGILKMREELIRISDKFKPDLIFMQIQTPEIIDPATASRLKGYVINWTGDVREEAPRWMRDLARYVDATCFTNETDVIAMQDEGYNSFFMQIGFESQIFKPEGAKVKYDYFTPDIVFMGNNYGKDRFPLSEERYNIAHALKKKYRSKFLLCGQGWDIDSINLMGRPNDEAMIYRSCKIAINSNHFIHERFSSDRVFRIMGSGAFCLTRWYPGIEKDFIDGVHLKTFRTTDEMFQLIDYYLKNETERMTIAEAGCELVHSKFRWLNNVPLIKQIASFPQEKLKIKNIVITKPLPNKDWIHYLKTGEINQ